jgi:hypothetical protein
LGPAWFKLDFFQYYSYEEFKIFKRLFAIALLIVAVFAFLSFSPEFSEEFRLG